MAEETYLGHAHIVPATRRSLPVQRHLNREGVVLQPAGRINKAQLDRLASPRARIRIQELLRQGQRPLNLQRTAGQVTDKKLERKVAIWRL